MTLESSIAGWFLFKCDERNGTLLNCKKLFEKKWQNDKNGRRKPLKTNIFKNNWTKTVKE
jgi:hypothetical protein